MNYIKITKKIILFIGYFIGLLLFLALAMGLSVAIGYEFIHPLAIGKSDIYQKFIIYLWVFMCYCFLYGAILLWNKICEKILEKITKEKSPWSDLFNKI